MAQRTTTTLLLFLMMAIIASSSINSPLSSSTTGILLVEAASSSSRTTTFSQACFVPPASPVHNPAMMMASTTSTTTSTAPTFAKSGGANPLAFSVFTRDAHTHHHSAAASSSRQQQQQTSTALHAKKAGGAAAATKKIQVKMLKHVKGTGQAGEVVMVTPAYFNNKLRPTKSAQIISNEQVELEQAQRQEQEAQELESATSLQAALTAEGFQLQITAKAGPSGQLFGGINAKAILQELQAQAPHAYWQDHSGKKGGKVAALADDAGKKLRGDIKHTGRYTVTLALSKDMSAKFPLNIEAAA